MRLIGKAYAQGYFAQRRRAGHHQVAGSLQAPSHHVGMRRLPNGQLELPGKVRGASTCDCTEVSDVNGTMQIPVDVSSHTQDLPGRQTAPCGAVAARVSLDLRLQDVGCRGQRRSGRISITLQLSPRRSKQRGQAVRNQVELLVSCEGQYWWGSRKSCHSHSLDDKSDSPDRRESAARRAAWLVK